MWYLYVLKSLNFNRHYIGSASNVNSRLAKHNSGSVTSTKSYRPWKVVHTEIYPDRTAAIKRELFLKRTARARVELFEKVDNGVVV